MPATRRSMITSNCSRQDITLAPLITTNATPTDMYTSTTSVPPSNTIYLEAVITVSNSTYSQCSNIFVSASACRASSGNIRLIDTNFLRAVGEIKAVDASAVWRVDTATQKFFLTVTGKAGTTYNWTGYLTTYRAF